MKINQCFQRSILIFFLHALLGGMAVMPCSATDDLSLPVPSKPGTGKALGSEFTLVYSFREDDVRTPALKAEVRNNIIKSYRQAQASGTMSKEAVDAIALSLEEKDKQSSIPRDYQVSLSLRNDKLLFLAQQIETKTPPSNPSSQTPQRLGIRRVALFDGQTSFWHYSSGNKSTQGNVARGFRFGQLADFPLLGTDLPYLPFRKPLSTAEGLLDLSAANPGSDSPLYQPALITFTSKEGVRLPLRAQIRSADDSLLFSEWQFSDYRSFAGTYIATEIKSTRYQVVTDEGGKVTTVPAQVRRYRMVKASASPLPLKQFLPAAYLPWGETVVENDGDSTVRFRFDPKGGDLKAQSLLARSRAAKAVPGELGKTAEAPDTVPTVTPITAAALMGAAKRGAGDSRRILLIFGATWCGACRSLEAILDSKDASDVIKKHFVLVHMNVFETEGKQKTLYETPGGVALMDEYTKSRGLPYWTTLDSKGNKIGDCMSPEGQVGAPATLSQIEFFLKTLRQAAPKMTDEEQKVIELRLRKLALEN
ncbi:MAG: thioredoxin family protein [Cytophagales bacterium]|nr:thioredoxin family protein [Armatimonadota bacterium]